MEEGAPSTPPATPPSARAAAFSSDWEDDTYADSSMPHLRPGLTVMAYHCRDASLSSLESWNSADFGSCRLDDLLDHHDINNMDPLSLSASLHSPPKIPPIPSTEVVLTHTANRLRSSPEPPTITINTESMLARPQILACSSPEIRALCQQQASSMSSITNAKKQQLQQQLEQEPMLLLLGSNETGTTTSATRTAETPTSSFTENENHPDQAWESNHTSNTKQHQQRHPSHRRRHHQHHHRHPVQPPTSLGMKADPNQHNVDTTQLSSSLHKIRLFHAEGGGESSTTSSTSCTTQTSGPRSFWPQHPSSSQQQQRQQQRRRPSLHRRISFNTLPSMDEILSHANANHHIHNNAMLARPGLRKAVSVRQIGSAPAKQRYHHRRSTTQFSLPASTSK